MTPSVPQIRVCLADDHPLILEGIRWLLSQTLHIRIAGVAHHPAELLDLLAKTTCDVLVTDFHMPGDHGTDGLPLLGSIRRLHPRVRILVLTSLRHAGLFQSILRLGVAGIVRKDGNMSQLATAIEVAHHGGRFVGTALRQEDADPAAAALLSASELEVLRLHAGGMSVSEIAAYLNRSIKTISTHKRATMDKLGIHTDAGLFLYARNNGLA
ncbi:response regulator transcription factor [Cupriavidus pauculus]|uniref:response regulator transcription factor n=1 Tax=Cupriavidus pauculus TaxID=82633 RepID=UPI001EE352E3|nr:response regulator transcription factor [Cupriavidus pauculus]GJG92937.1 response regulator transcription factor [Cupriavidus pauculus]